MANDLPWVNLTLHPLASDWAARVVANGGAAPSIFTQIAISNFCGALDAAGITNLMIALSVFSPDSLTAAITPLIKNTGNDPWTNNNFVEGDLTVNGLKADGASKYLNTGEVLTAPFAGNEGGLSIYNTFVNYSSGLIEMGTFNGSASGIRILADSLGSAAFDCWNAAGGRLSGTPLTYGLGFISGSRTAASLSTLYTASSTQAFGSAGTNVNAQSAVTIPSCYVFCSNNNGVASTFSYKRLSFAAIHHGLTSVQTEALFRAVQALRQQLNGGYV